MNDIELHALRALDPARPADPVAYARPDAQAMLTRVLETPVAAADALIGHAAPSRGGGRPRGWRLATLVGAAAALATLGVVLPTLGERSADAWTATPRPVSDERALAAVQECLNLWPELADQDVAPMLAERRGASELVVLAGDDWDAQCLVSHGGAAGALARPDATPPTGPPGAEEARFASGMTMLAGDGEYVVAVFGELGDDVIAVTMLPRDTEPVHATVANGYFAAFWPQTTARSGHLDKDNLTARLVLRSGEVRDVSFGAG